ncbi:Validoxylamine A 7'-phosphate phosphatase [Propionicimonas sp. T2.31MG-18]|uniref:HAD family hydrolase n=1 Tax=Propionicimonas sp. T2.31MG-18 TaxID=3157620 RepID=UPI0035EB2B93
MPEPAALLLDLDGTLVDSEGFHRQVFRNWFAARGWPASDELLAGFTGRRADDVFATQPGPWDGEDAEAMTAELLTHVAGLPQPGLAPGAAELVAGARVPLGLVTSATHEWARTCLGDLLDHFAAVVTRDEVSRGKPDPEPYLLACRALGVSAPDCLAVEDAPAGVASAVAAGVGLVVAVSTTFTSIQLSAAHLVVPGLDHVPGLLTASSWAARLGPSS